MQPQDLQREQAVHLEVGDGTSEKVLNLDELIHELCRNALLVTPLCMGLRAHCALQVEEMQRRDSERNERLQEVQASLAQHRAEVAHLQAANAHRHQPAPLVNPGPCLQPDMNAFNLLESVIGLQAVTTPPASTCSSDEPCSLSAGRHKCLQPAADGGRPAGGKHDPGIDLLLVCRQGESSEAALSAAQYLNMFQPSVPAHACTE